MHTHMFLLESQVTRPFSPLHSSDNNLSTLWLYANFISFYCLSFICHIRSHLSSTSNFSLSICSSTHPLPTHLQQRLSAFWKILTGIHSYSRRISIMYNFSDMLTNTHHYLRVIVVFLLFLPRSSFILSVRAHPIYLPSIHPSIHSLFYSIIHSFILSIVHLSFYIIFFSPFVLNFCCFSIALAPKCWKYIKWSDILNHLSDKCTYITFPSSP